MNSKQIINAIEGMRNREDLTAVINAAEARDCHLSNLESDERRQRAWAKFSHLRKGDTVFIHKQPEPDNPYAWMWGRPLKVKRVKPRVKEIVLDGAPDKRATLTALVMHTLKLSEVPTGEALEYVLKGGQS